MNVGASSNDPGGWLASTIKQLLDEKYGKGQVPGARRISFDIAQATGGDTISHGALANLLNGEVEYLKLKTASVLSRFFGKPTTFFNPPTAKYDRPDEADANNSKGWQALAARYPDADAHTLKAVEEMMRVLMNRKQDKP